MDEEKDDERKQTKTATKIKQSMHNDVTLDEPNYNCFDLRSETCNYDQNNCKVWGKGDSFSKNVRPNFHRNMFSSLEDVDLQTKEIYSRNILSSHSNRDIGASPQLRTCSRVIEVEGKRLEETEDDGQEEWKEVVYRKKRLFQSRKNDNEKEESRVIKEEDDFGKNEHRRSGKKEARKRENGERNRGSYQGNKRESRRMEKRGGASERNNGHQRTMFNSFISNPERNYERKKNIRIDINTNNEKCVICSDTSILAIYDMSKIVFCLCSLNNLNFSDKMSKEMKEGEKREQVNELVEDTVDKLGKEKEVKENPKGNDPGQHPNIPTSVQAAAA